MRTIACLITVSLFFSCNKKRISLNFENASVLDSVNIFIYKNNFLYKSVWIKYSRIADKFTTFVTEADDKKMSFVFVNKTMNMSDSCIVESDSIKKVAFLLISSQDFVAKKGWEYGGTILDKDSIRRDFFCSTYY